MDEGGYRDSADPLGGGQEQGRQGGTENVVGIAGFGGAIDSLTRRISDQPRQQALRDTIENELKSRFSGLFIHGDLINRLANTLHFRIEGIPGEVLLQALDLEGVSISSGSACSSGALEPSDTLLAMGLNPQEARSGLRVSIGTETNEDDIKQLLDALSSVIPRIVA